IVDLARRMIRLAGATVRNQTHPGGDIELTFTGLRPGEKLYEELLIASSSVGTGHSKIGCAEEAAMEWSELAALIQEMDIAAGRRQRGAMKSLLQKAVPEYAAAEQDYDAISGEKDNTPAKTAQSANPKVVPLQ